MAVRQRLLELLCDGRFHSGQSLGDVLGVSRAAVWKQIRGLKDEGLEIRAVSGRGYQLAGPVELLDAAAIREAMSRAAVARLGGLEIHFELPSTNTWLRERDSTGLPSASACLAERQSAGRGRHGRRWASPFGGGVYLSLLWRFNRGPEELAGLSLAAGVATLRAIRAQGVGGAGLKWPNDVLWEGRKLAGVLLDISGESGGPCSVVFGIGVNVNTPARWMEAVSQPWTDLQTAARGRPVSRNRLAGSLLEELIRVLDAFEHDGLQPLLEEWRGADLAAGRPVRLTLPGNTIDGVARGIDADGALIIDDAGVSRRFAAGEVSLRMTP